jgi:hypothetical protein
MPDVFVELKLEMNRPAVLKDPVGQVPGIQDTEYRREEDDALA